MGNGDNISHGNDFGHDPSGILSTRNLMLALISVSLTGSVTSVVQSSDVTDRWTGDDQKRFEQAHLQKHESERELVISEYNALITRVNANEANINVHQDGHPARVEARIDRLDVRLEKTEQALRDLERSFDRRFPE